MTFVTKVAKEGYDVREAADKNLSYSAKLASHSIFNIISASLSAGGTSLTFIHGLDFVPKVWIFMVGSDGDGTFMRRIPYIDDNDFNVDFYITTSNIVIESDGGQASRLDFKVIIFTRSPQA